VKKFIRGEATPRELAAGLDELNVKPGEEFLVLHPAELPRSAGQPAPEPLPEGVPSLLEDRTGFEPADRTRSPYDPEVA
jgi:hypothetical protein